MANRRIVAVCMTAALCGICTAANADLVVSGMSFDAPGGIQRFSDSGMLEATLGSATGISKLSLTVGQNGNLYSGGMGLQSGQYYEFNPLNNARIPLNSVPSTIPGAGVMTVGWNGDLFAPGWNHAVAGAVPGIVELDGTSGAYLGTPLQYTGTSPFAFRDAAFSPDNQLYVADLQQITRYESVGGAITQDTSFTIPITFGTNPNATGVIRFKAGSSDLYVSDRSSIRVYSESNGSLLSTFIAAGTGGLRAIDDFTFGDDGYAYVVSDNGTGTVSVLRFDASTGSFVGTVIGPMFGSGVPQIAYVPHSTALLGDANQDGRVDLSDLNVVLNDLGKTSTDWGAGNFDGAATIDLTDLNDVLNHLGVGAAPALAAPEPASLGILAIGALGLLGRRRVG
jgi:hypothetical protein